MGLIGLLIVTLVMILGGGYWFFSNSSQTLTVTNEGELPAMTEDLSRYEELRQEALDTKSLVEEKVEEAMKTGESTESPQSPDREQPKENVSVPGTSSIVDRLMSSGFTVPKTPRTIDAVILHSSYDAIGGDPYSVAGIVKEYEDYGVSAHYLIDRQGTIYRLVADKDIAYHAGVSKMPDGRTNANDFSIGIEIMNTKTGKFTSAQYDAVNELIRLLKKQYSIKSIVGHADIAPGRKTDPWNFDWKKLK